VDLALNKADAALYTAKRAGKGRIVFHREPVVG
jgi:GGDEF domain-containing protein